MDHYVDVIIPLALDQLFTYHVDDDEFNQIQIGCRVVVPFGKTKVYTGIIAATHQQPPIHYKTKPIEQVLDEKPLVTQNQISLWKWMSEYYLVPIGLILKTAIPSSLLLESETSIALTQNETINKNDLSDNEFLIVEALEKQSEMRVNDVKDILQKKTVLPVLYQLVKKDIVDLKQALIHKYQPKLIKYLILNPKYEKDKALNELLQSLASAEKQKQVLMSYFHLKHKQKKFLQRKDLAEAAEVSPSTVKNLIDKAILVEHEIQEDRTFKNIEATNKSFDLSKAQETAKKSIDNYFQQQKPCLLHGVTSSGKTEIYIRLIDQVLKKGQQALYLVPEIALTTQLISRLEAYFGDQVLIYHSKNQPSVSVEVYQHMLDASKAQVVIGVRSAIFLPFQQLGLIIVDEAHEASFKQQDPAPRYNARDVALYMSHLLKCSILLGTATPSLESLYNVKNGKLSYVRLDQRHGKVKLPKIEMIDLANAMKTKQMKGHFSQSLLKEMKIKLDNDQQILLFQNRRGHSPILECQTCGFTPQCRQCDVTLTYHQFDYSLKCHYCGYKIALQKNCLACGSSKISMKGFGTEQIEEEIQDLFPDAKVARMDRDTTNTKRAYERIIASFERHEIDILVGTQMVTKGLDFRKLALVAVMNADRLLHFPDFRAEEKCFQLLTQVAGRSGRTDERGKVFIQTYQPEHEIYQQVIIGDFKSFYKKQMQQRQDYAYPPYHKLVEFTLQSSDYNRLNEAADWLAQYLRQGFKSQVLGPEFPSVARVKNRYRKQILIKIYQNQSLKHAKSLISKSLNKFDQIAPYRSIRVNVNVDPY
ncbi:MAG: primosomal protein N' [Psychroflexus sp.]|nr:primosomal protein N' [Psychroflexus sp.]